nr:hypothetical protein BaRGS_021530 [Batillaria attramentaria]
MKTPNQKIFILGGGVEEGVEEGGTIAATEEEEEGEVVVIKAMAMMLQPAQPKMCLPKHPKRPKEMGKRQLTRMRKLQAFGDWQDFSKEDSFDIEKQFCQFANQETFEVVLDNIGGLKLSIHFGTLTATVEDAYTSASRISVYQNLQLRRWSTPSYMEAETKAASQLLHSVVLELFQYTLEEKYISGQSKYFYEHGERQLMIHLQEMVQVDLDTGMAVSVFRRPIFHSVITSAPEMSSLLLKEPPAPLSHPPPTHWSKVDLLHDFELVELEKSYPEYLIQYEDSGAQGQGLAKTHSLGTLPATASVGLGTMASAVLAV